jgi:TRAP-type C4-dicarboxylate transport system permease small subunit
VANDTGDSPDFVNPPTGVTIADAEGPKDEPALARAIRRIDESIGEGERLIMTMTFAFLIAVGFYRTLADLAWNQRPLWAVEGIRVAVFAIAMMGAAFATHHKRNFNLDLLSKLFGPKGRAYLRVVLNLVAIAAATLLFYGGWLVKKIISVEKDYELVPKWVIGWFIPIAASLIIVHLILHSVIELVYLSNGKIAPEPEMVVG